MATPKPFTKQSIVTTSDQDALQIKDIKGDVVGWIDSSGTGQGNLASGGGGGTPSGSNTQIQFNDSGSFGGNANFAFNKSVNTVGGVGIGPGNTPGQIDPISGETSGPTGTSILDVTQSISSASLPNNVSATLVSGIEANPSADSSNTYFALWNIASSKSTNTHTISQIVAQLVEADHLGSGAVTNIIGVTGGAFNDSSGSVASIAGLLYSAQNAGSGPATSVTGILIESTGAAGSGTVTNNYGIRVASPSTAAVVSHNYGLRIEDQTGGGGNNPDTWAIFVAAAADKSQLGIVQMQGALTKYNNISTVANGIPSIYGQANLTAQGANVAATTLYAVPASGTGIYEITVYIVVSQPGTNSSTLPDSRLIYTDQDSSATITVNATASSTGNTTSTFQQFTFVVNAKASTNIQYDIGQVTPYATSGATSMQFAYRARAKYLG